MNHKDRPVSFLPQTAIDPNAMELGMFSRGGFRTRHRVLIVPIDILLKEYPHFVIFCNLFFAFSSKKQK